MMQNYRKIGEEERNYLGYGEEVQNTCKEKLQIVFLGFSVVQQ
jgi:hypothetical protein